MKRRMKFRAWDEIIKEMVDIEFMDFSGKRCEQTTKIVGYAGYPELRDDMCPLDNLMEFTGLKCENGQSIFVGDIVKLSCWDCVKYPEGMTAEVIESRLGFAFKIIGEEKAKHHNWNAGMHDCSRYCEYIMGNIYKNPELLEDDAPQEKAE